MHSEKATRSAQVSEEAVWIVLLMNGENEPTLTTRFEKLP